MTLGDPCKRFEVALVQKNTTICSSVLTSDHLLLKLRRILAIHTPFCNNILAQLLLLACTRVSLSVDALARKCVQNAMSRLQLGDEPHDIVTIHLIKQVLLSMNTSLRSKKGRYVQ